MPGASARHCDTLGHFSTTFSHLIRARPGARLEGVVVIRSARIRPLRTVAVGAVAVLVGAFGAPVAEAAEKDVPVAVGVRLASLASPAAGGKEDTALLTVELGGEDGAEVAYLDAGAVAATATVPEMAGAFAAPVGRDLVAAANGDFFDIGATGAPRGAAMRGGEALKSPTGDRVEAAVFDADGTGRIGSVRFEGTAALPDGEAELDALNAHIVPDDGLGLYTPEWGDHSRKGAADGADRAAEAVVSGGVVREVRDGAGGGAIEEGTEVLLGLGKAADRVAGLDKGDSVSVDYRLDAGGPARTVIGGHRVLVRDGAPTGASDGARHPRTAIGFSAEGDRMFLAAVDGRVSGVPGATLPEVARVLADAGADQALELDGGGSSALFARSPGEDGLKKRNRNGGERERPVPNGLAVTAVSGDTLAAGPGPDRLPRSLPPSATPRTAQAGPDRELAVGAP